MVGIYSFKNELNGKRYIGQSVNIQKRKNKHLYLYKSSHLEESDRVLYNAIRKYGIENFSFEILEEVEKEDLNRREIFWIEYYNTFLDGYNATLGGEGGNGIVGELHYKTKLTNDDVLQIKALLQENKLTQTEIARQFNTESDVLCLINTGVNWRSVGNYEYPIRKPDYRIGKRFFTDEEVLFLREQYVNEQAEVLYKDYENRCALTTFRGMLSGGTYKHLPIYKKREKKWV